MKIDREDFRLTDLFVVASLSDNLLLLISEDSIGKQGQICIQVDLTRRSYIAYEMDLLMKFNPYQWVDVRKETIQFYHRDMIYRKLGVEMIMTMLEDYLDKVQEHKINYEKNKNRK